MMIFAAMDDLLQTAEVQEFGFFLNGTSGCVIAGGESKATLMDVAPTILDLLGIDWRRYDFDGRSIFGK